MRTIFFILSLFLSSFAFAQWSNTTNNFADSLHMPVSVAPGDQARQIIINSLPDNGYIVIWEDHRSQTTNKRDIYAQKFDKNGNKLWTENGIPVATGANDQYYARTGATGTTSSSGDGDYRNYSYAVTDNNGGFFIAFQSDSTHSTTWGRIAIQHILSNGKTVYGEMGKLIALVGSASTYQYSFPQLIADGQNGFFVSYLRNYASAAQVLIYGYKEQGGKLVSYGGGEMNRHAYTTDVATSCFTRKDITFEVPIVRDYMIWPDKQGGCNVIMSMHARETGNAPQGILGYNRVCRIKKDKIAIVRRRQSDLLESKVIERRYKKDSVVVLHQLTLFTHGTNCNTVAHTSYHIENGGWGYLALDRGYDFYFAKGATLSTTGNINIDVIAVTKRILSGNSPGKFTPMIYTLPSEIYDAIPYQLDSDDQYNRAIRDEPEGKVLDKINFTKDTLLASENYFLDFCMKASGNKIYAIGNIDEAPGTGRTIYFQQLEVEKGESNTFNILNKTGSKKGTSIGREINTGYGVSEIGYDRPQISTDEAGNAIFYITEKNRFIRISPVINVAQLKWGAMGKLIGTGFYKNGRYQPAAPVVALDLSDGTGVISWNDNRNFTPNTGGNVFIRQLSGLSASSVIPNRSVKQMSKGISAALPYVMLGSSGQYTALEVSQNNTGVLSPVAEIQDTYNLGIIEMNVYQHEGPIRKYQDTAYMNINYTIKPQNMPQAEINLRLFFSNQDFMALQTADPNIKTPGYLMVVQQPNNTATVPAAYTPVNGEKRITPTSWQEVDGGYYLEFPISGFSNFFIRKNSKTITVPLAASRSKLKEAIKLFPNPVDSELFISGLMRNDQILITDLYNRLVKVETVVNSEQSVWLNGVSSGLYIVTVIRGMEMEVLKIIKK